MPALDTFAICRMTQFAALISNELDVAVVLRGDDVCVDMSRQPPTIYMPAMEYPREENLKPMKGFVLHEAAHIRYTDPRVLEKIENYLTFRFFNQIEDEFIERRLERDFPGARGMLVDSYAIGLSKISKAMKREKEFTWDGETFLGEEGLSKTFKTMSEIVNLHLIDNHMPTNDPASILSAREALGMDFNDRACVDKFAKRLEADRVARMWFIHRRKYPLPTFDYETHPWRPVFEEVLATKAKSTKDSLSQALEIIRRLGVEPCLPKDDRPVKAAMSAMDEAFEAQRKAAETLRRLAAMNREIAEKIRELFSECGENKALLEARERRHDAKEDLREARERVKELAEKRRGLRDERKQLAESIRRRKAGIKRLESSREKTPKARTPAPMEAVA